MSVLDDPKLEVLLDALHAQSGARTRRSPAISAAASPKARSTGTASTPKPHAFFRDKLVALEKDKAEYCYALCRALGAKRVVEAGTSYGVSTLYLAAALRDNGGGTVIATEYEAEKAEAARRNFAAAGLAQYIDLREGDLRETLKRIDGPVDFMLLDIWTQMVVPAVTLVLPHLRKGGIVIADNVTSARQGYADYFAFLADPAHGLRTLTLPFEGGLGMSVKV